MKRGSYILKGGRIIDPDRGIDKKGDLGIENGVIVNPRGLKDAKKIDVSGCVVAPGFIDVHVHLRQPGNTMAETIATGTAAAAAGGFTSIVAMPNTSPPADNPGAIELLRKLAEKEGVVKVLACGCLSKDRAGKEMAGIGGLHAAGVVALSDDGNGVQDHSLMRHMLEYANSFDLPVLDHCEDENLAAGGVMHEGQWSVLLGMDGISSLSEELMIARDVMLSRLTGGRIHIQHVSAKESVALIRAARQGGLRVSAEATPHHIALTDELIKTYDTNYKMNPPLRAEADRLALIEGLRDGTITVIATDHAPHTATAKLVEFNDAPFGIIGLETALPVTLTLLYHGGVLSLPELVAKFTVGPAEVLGWKHYNLGLGRPADVTVFDPEAAGRIDAATFKSRSRNTPFDGMAVRGRNRLTIVDGRIVYGE